MLTFTNARYSPDLNLLMIFFLLSLSIFEWTTLASIPRWSNSSVIISACSMSIANSNHFFLFCALIKISSIISLVRLYLTNFCTSSFSMKSPPLILISEVSISFDGALVVKLHKYPSLTNLTKAFREVKSYAISSNRRSSP